MGCWNGTCGISQLPILAGTKVKTFLMLQSEFCNEMGGAGVCYSTTYFRPWFFPVNAQYNDYGSIEEIEKDWNSDYMLETFQNWLAEGKVKILDKDAEINSPGIRKFKTLDDVFDCVERGALVYKHKGERFDRKEEKWIPTETFLKIGMFMVLATVYDALLAETKNFISASHRAYYRDREESILPKALKAIKQARQDNNTQVSELDEMIRSTYVDQLLGDMIEEHQVFQHYKRILFHPTKITIDEFLLRLEEMKNIGIAMSYLRKLWMPQAGQGSQGEELSFNKALAQSMLTHIQNREIENEKYRLEDEALTAKFLADKKKKAEK